VLTCQNGEPPANDFADGVVANLKELENDHAEEQEVNQRPDKEDCEGVK
jgi:hypothetical protein